MSVSLDSAAAAPALDRDAALSVAGVSKRFGGQLVLDAMSLTLAPGEVHGLVGHNGSGKSTFVKILSGFHAPDGDWRAHVRGEPLALGDPQAARAAGLRFVHQDLGLIGSLDAVDNIRLGGPYPRTRSRRIDRAAARREAREALAALGFEPDVDRPVDELSAADRTGIALGRALNEWEGRPAVLVLDEPTAALPAAAVERMFEAIRRISAAGVAVLYISHHLDELFANCGRLTVLRDGRTVAQVATGELDHDGLVELMLGSQVELTAAAGSARRREGAPVLSVERLRAGRMEPLSFSVHAGEIVGFAGVDGCGRERVADMLFGAVERSGEVVVAGRPVRSGRPDDAVVAGIGLVPANRQRNALLGAMTLSDNLTIARLPVHLRGLLLSRAREQAEVRDWLGRLHVRPSDPRLAVTKLSGGNQQRLVIGRWLRLEPKVLILDEPTQGVDVGAVEVIYALLRDAAAAGTAIVVCSSDTDELATLCDRLVVMRRDRAAYELEAPLDHDHVDALMLTEPKAA